MDEFKGTVVLVTGAVRNTGLCIARAFLHEGATVWVNGRREDATHAAVETLNAEGLPGRAVAAVADVSTLEAVRALFRSIAKAGAGLDVLVNNAVDQGIGGPFGEVDDALLETVFRTNVFGYFRCGQEAARLMKAQGRRGCIVNVGSNVSERAIRNRSAYVASKGAIDALTRAMAIDLAPHGIRVNTVAPGYINTERWSVLDPAVAARRRANVPLGREASGENVAHAILFMASGRSGNVTGTRLVVDGGCSAQHLPADGDL
jgi:NAD(P)-dependent dehydrogenase (short-subunit alcohol dehydrogenase family)